MGPVSTALLKAVLLAGVLNPAPEIDPPEFRGWFESSLRGDLEIPGEIAERARELRYVFVLGLLHERMPGYFEQTIRELVELGVPTGSIHRIAPSSDSLFAENLAAIRDAFRMIASRGPERLVIIGHSRGACDALGFALREPSFVRRQVAALFLIQGPFGGSGAADYLVGTGVPMDSRMPPLARVLANLLRNAEARKLDRGKHGGIADLTSDAARSFWERELIEHAEAIPVVGPRTFYIESSVSPTRQPPLRRPVARYLETYYGPNDGLVAASDQCLSGLGTRLGMFDVGHTDLTHRFPAARPQRRLRGALAQAIVMAIARPGSELEPTSEDAALTSLRQAGPSADGSGRAVPR